MNKKLVSIVLPVYNGEKYLSQSIESVLNQTYRNLELIIVNDCSTDSTEDIVKVYAGADKRIVYLRNEINSKLPASLNNGFAKARGEYYSWTSDDNIYHCNAIEKMVEYLEESPEAGMVYCNYNRINERGDYLAEHIAPDIDKLIFMNVIGACFLYRSSVAKEVGNYSTSYFLAEDYEYWLRIYLHNTIQKYNECLYDYRMHENSLTATRKQEVVQTTNRMQWDYLDKLAEVLPAGRLYLFFEFLLKNSSKGERNKKRAFVLKHPAYLWWAFIHSATIILEKIRRKFYR